MFSDEMCCGAATVPHAVKVTDVASTAASQQPKTVATLVPLRSLWRAARDGVQRLMEIAHHVQQIPQRNTPSPCVGIPTGNGVPVSP